MSNVCLGKTKMNLRNLGAISFVSRRKPSMKAFQKPTLKGLQIIHISLASVTNTHPKNTGTNKSLCVGLSLISRTLFDTKFTKKNLNPAVIKTRRFVTNIQTPAFTVQERKCNLLKWSCSNTKSICPNIQRQMSYEKGHTKTASDKHRRAEGKVLTEKT